MVNAPFSGYFTFVSIIYLHTFVVLFVRFILFLYLQLFVKHGFGKANFLF